MMRLVMRRLVIPCFAALVLAAPACADSIGVSLTFAPGKLSLAAPSATATEMGATLIPVTISDARGSGRGWTLRISAGRPVTISRVTARCADGSTCRLPAEARKASGSVVLEARHGTGMGVVSLVVTVAALPAGTPATPLAFSVS
jgi:hypothetical protein